MTSVWDLQIIGRKQVKAIKHILRVRQVFFATNGSGRCHRQDERLDCDVSCCMFCFEFMGFYLIHARHSLLTNGSLAWDFLFSDSHRSRLAENCMSPKYATWLDNSRKLTTVSERVRLAGLETRISPGLGGRVRPSFRAPSGIGCSPTV